MFHERTPHSGRFPKLLTILVLLCVVVSLTSAVNAQVATLTPVDFPPNITLCEPVNFTWTGGTPPYWLYVYGDVSGKLVAQNTTGIPTSWFVWIPDIPAVPGSSLRFQIGDSATRTTASLSQLVGSEGSSCLGSSSAAAAATASSTVGVTSPRQSTSSPSTNDDTTPSSSQPTTVSQSAAIPATHRGGRLSRAAVAGVAASGTFVGIALVVLAWFTAVSARRKRGVRQPEPGQADFDASPSPYPCPISTSTIDGHASGGVPLSIPPNSTTLDLANQSPPPPASTDSEQGYSVMADVGGPLGPSPSPVSPSLEMATDPLSSATGNLGLSQPGALVHRVPHQELRRKRGWTVPVAPPPHELAELRVECDGVTPPGVSESESRRTSHGAVEPEHGPVDGWEVWSPSDGTTLPPYAP